MKNVSVRYYQDLKKLFIVRHRNDPRKVLEKTEVTSGILNEIIHMVADFEKDGHLITFKASERDYALVVMSVEDLQNIQYIKTEYAKMIAEQQKIQVNPIINPEEAPVVAENNVATESSGEENVEPAEVH
jgi:hypothetical protein